MPNEASQHLPIAITLLAFSVAGLAAVLASNERGRQQRTRASVTSAADARSLQTVGCKSHSERSLSSLAASGEPPSAAEAPTHATASSTSRREQSRNDGPNPSSGQHHHDRRPTRSASVAASVWPRPKVKSESSANGREAGSLFSPTRAAGTDSSPSLSHVEGAAVVPPEPGRSRLRYQGAAAATEATTAAATRGGANRAEATVPNGRAGEPSPLTDGQHLEILVHNVSHKDMVVSLRRLRSAASAPSAPDSVRKRTSSSVINAADSALARPKFSLFKASSELILNRLLQMREAGASEPPPAVCEVYQREEKSVLSGERSGDEQSPWQRQAAVGFDLDDTPIPIPDLAGYRVRSSDLNRLVPPGGGNGSGGQNADFQISMYRRDSSGACMYTEGRPSSRSNTPVSKAAVQGGSRGCGAVGVEGWKDGQGGEAFITGVYFPLLSVLMPKWLEQLPGNGGSDAAKTILLVSGVGQPRNEEHRVEDNSTEVTAILMEVFLRRHYPDVRVVRVHSDTNIFRYDDNIRFVKSELLPLLNAERTRMAEKHGEDWQDMMHITMSFADGSPARISSINTALRHFRPSFIHIWELKTFWHEKRVCEDDVEVHTFEDIDMLPPIPAREVDNLTALVIAEMKRLRDDLERILAAPVRGGVVGSDARDDLASFWLRKTKRPVLAVLLVQKKGCRPKLYRGTNMEVSMPTGSLCAERNVIGSALAADLTLLRGDIKAVAVLSAPRLGKAPTAASVAPDDRAASLASNGGASRSWALLGTASAGASTVPSRTGSPAPSSTPAALASPASLGPGDKDARSFKLHTVPQGGARCWGSGHAGSAGGGLDRGDDRDRLEGVRQALFAVAGKGDAGTRDFGVDSMAPASAERSHLLLEANEGRQYLEGRVIVQSDPRRGQGRVEDRRLADGQGESEAIEHTGKEASAASATASVEQVGRPAATRSNSRFRSESCADELLAAGPGASDGALDRESARSGGSMGVGDQERGDRGQARSQSFDWSESESQRRPKPAVAGGEVLRKKILRGTKIVRSISTTPNRADAAVGDRDSRLTEKDAREDSMGTTGGRAALHQGSGRGHRLSHTSVVAHVPAETLCSNPLKPCGACMEWLRKIAEINPDFKVITFTDSGCEGVYIEDVAQVP